MHREAEQRARQADAVRRAGVDQTQSLDGELRTVHRLHRAEEVDDAVGDDRAIGLDAARDEPRRRVVEARVPDVEEQHAAQAAEHTHRRQHRLDEREAQLDVREERLVADELEVVEPAHLGVAAVIHEVRIAAPALEAAEADGEHAGGPEPVVVPGIEVDSLALEPAGTKARRGLVRDSHGVARHWTEVAKHRRLLHERDADRRHVPLAEDRIAELIDLIGIGVLLQQRVVVVLRQVHVPAEHLDAVVPGQRVDRERGKAALARRRDRVVPVDVRRETRVIQGRVVAVVEDVLEEALQRVLDSPLAVQVGEGRRTVLIHLLGVERNLFVAHHVGERDLRVAVEVAAGRHAEADRRPAREAELLERALLVNVVLDHRVAERRLEVDDRPGRSEVRRGGRGNRLVWRDDLDAVLALVVGDEPDPEHSARPDDDRRDVARHRVRPLLQFAGGEVERPDVRDVRVPGELRRGRRLRIHRRGREDNRLVVDELRGRCRHARRRSAASSCRSRGRA